MTPKFPWMISPELMCIMRLSFSFMTLFAAETSKINLQKTLMSSIQDEQPAFQVDGYILNAISYSLFTIFVLFVAPYINHVAGARLTMFICSLGILLSICCLLVETPAAVYAGAVVAGVCSGILWPAECHYMIKNSSPETTGRNVSIFWCIYSSSNLVGNLGIYYAFHNKKYVDHSTRQAALLCLVGLNVIAVVQFALLPKPLGSHKPTHYGALTSLRTMISLLKSDRIIWLLPLFCYTGILQSFWNGIYSSSIGFTLAFGDSVKELVPLSGITMSIGAITGSCLSILLSGLVARRRCGRRLLVAVAGLAGLCSFLIAFLNLPDQAVFGNTNQHSLVTPPSVPMVLLGGFLICVGDSFINIQVQSLIGDYYREISTEACAFYKFTKNLFLSASFFWCSYVGLHAQLTLLAAMAVVAVAGFCVGDRRGPTMRIQPIQLHVNQQK